MFSYVLTRPPDRSRRRPIARRPRSRRDCAGADPGPRAELEPLIVEASGSRRQPMYVVMKDGREAANTGAPLRPSIRAQVVDAIGWSAERREQRPLAQRPGGDCAHSTRRGLRGWWCCRRRPRAAVRRGRPAVVVARHPGAPDGDGSGRRAASWFRRDAGFRRSSGGGTARGRRSRRPGAGQRHDEIARAGAAFNRMADRLAARDRGAAHLGSVAPPDARRRLARAEDAADGDARLRRHAAHARTSRSTPIAARAIWRPLAAKPVASIVLSRTCSTWRARERRRQPSRRGSSRSACVRARHPPARTRGRRADVALRRR